MICVSVHQLELGFTWKFKSNLFEFMKQILDFGDFLQQLY